MMNRFMLLILGICVVVLMLNNVRCQSNPHSIEAHEESIRSIVMVCLRSGILDSSHELAATTPYYDVEAIVLGKNVKYHSIEINNEIDSCCALFVDSNTIEVHFRQVGFLANIIKVNLKTNIGTVGDSISVPDLIDNIDFGISQKEEFLYLSWESIADFYEIHWDYSYLDSVGHVEHVYNDTLITSTSAILPTKYAIKNGRIDFYVTSINGPFPDKEAIAKLNSINYCYLYIKNSFVPNVYSVRLGSGISNDSLRVDSTTTFEVNNQSSYTLENYIKKLGLKVEN